jgi:hypothetical protein
MRITTMRYWLAAALALPVLAFALRSEPAAQGPVAAARAFMESLDRTQQSRAIVPFSDGYRTTWRYTPANRRGIPWKEMSVGQSEKAKLLLKATLSDLGYQRTQDVRTIEEILSRIENNRWRDKEYYFITFFGQPSAREPWAWRYEGHHVSLNFTYHGSKLVASTPQFFGSNPAEVRDGPHKGMRMLAREEDLGIALLASLTPEQRAIAIIGPSAPYDIFTREDPVAARQAPRGIRYAQLTDSQKKALLDLIRVNAEAQEAAEVKRRMDAIEKAGLDDIVFAWMGVPDRSGGHYYRIQGPTFLIEFDNAEHGANHIHVVWRDFDGDFGRDVLKDHYENHKHDPNHGHTH